MKNDRQKIREFLEQESQQPPSKEEVDAVVRLFAVLEKEDQKMRLPADFSMNVLQRIAQKQTRENRFGWFGFFLGIFSLVICLIVSLASVEFTLDFGFLKNIKAYSGLFLFGIAFILFLNFIEKKVLRYSSL